MALNAYRRHGSHCPGGRTLHDMTYEADELRRAWKKCSCPIYASGTLDGQFKRKNTERTTWPEAKAVVAEWETAGSWGAPGRLSYQRLRRRPSIRQHPDSALPTQYAPISLFAKALELRRPPFASIERSRSNSSSL